MILTKKETKSKDPIFIVSFLEISHFNKYFQSVVVFEPVRICKYWMLLTNFNLLIFIDLLIFIYYGFLGHQIFNVWKFQSFIFLNASHFQILKSWAFYIFNDEKFEAFKFFKASNFLRFKILSALYFWTIQNSNA